jgi:hypothetical protein
MNSFRATAVPWRWLLLSSLLVPAAGCALRDYEDRIDAQRKRLDVLDEENRFLNDSIEVPKTENKDGVKSLVWPFDVYARLPKDFGASINLTLSFNSQPLFRYGPREGYYAFAAAGLIPEKKENKDGKDAKDSKDSKGKDSKPAPSEWPVDTFRANVHGALREYCRKEAKIAGFPSLEGVSYTKMSKLPVNDQGESLPAIGFDVVYFKAGEFRFDLYFHQQSNRQAALVFQYPLAQATDDNLKKGIDWSLSTVAFGSEAANRRSALQKRRQFKR